MTILRSPTGPLRRPVDAPAAGHRFVAKTLQETLAAEGLVDPARTALIGYSMGGYGVLTAAGAALDPEGGAVKRVPGGLMLPFARGGASATEVLVKGLRRWWPSRPPAAPVASWARPACE